MENLKTESKFIQIPMKVEILKFQKNTYDSNSKATSSITLRVSM